VHSDGSPNTWDNGYPSGGNYWSDYRTTYPSAVENDSSALWNTPYVIDVNNTDRYPLMGPFHTFGVGTWSGVAYSVDTVSNSTITSLSVYIESFFPTYSVDTASKSTITNFTFNTTRILTFNVTGTSGTKGFCRVDIPTGLMWVTLPSQWTVIVGGTYYTNETIIPSGNYTYIYFTYTQGPKTVQVQSPCAIPEFQPIMLLPLFMILTLLAVATCRKRLLKTARAERT
jgi:hypothetical protein